MIQFIANFNKTVSKKIKEKVRLTKDDRKMLQALWNQLSQFAKKKDKNKKNKFAEWTAEGSAFQVSDVELFEQFLSDKTFLDNFDDFVARCGVLGFEMRVEQRLFHHPCFNKQQRRWISQIAKNSIDLASLNKFTNTSDAEDENENNNENNTNDTQMGNQQNQIDSAQPPSKKRRISQSQQSDISQYSMSESGQYQQYQIKQEQQQMGMGPSAVLIEMPRENFPLNMNQCHVWTEHDVADWLRNLGEYNGGQDGYSYRINREWGDYYAPKFAENGIDGRTLLEYKDVKQMAQLCGVNDYHVPVFIQAVNQLRLVRGDCMGIANINAQTVAQKQSQAPQGQGQLQHQPQQQQMEMKMEQQQQQQLQQQHQQGVVNGVQQQQQQNDPNVETQMQIENDNGNDNSNTNVNMSMNVNMNVNEGENENDNGNSYDETEHKTQEDIEM